MKEKINRLLTSPVFWLIIIMIVGSFVRLAALDWLPMGLHQDEAFSAYNAWSILHYGMDSEGYVRPIYYTVWGSGMSVLYSYLEMPFIAALGTTVTAIRLPQAILGSLSVLAAFFLGQEISDKWLGVALAAMTAINPWHIKQSRFGLDANLAVPMLLFGILFLCRYLNGKRRSIYPATIFLGLTLYCYAITWPLIPMLLVLTFLFYRKRICFDKHLLLCIGILFLMALPLLLFMMVNYGLLPELRTSVLSIPRLARMRSDEFAFSQIAAHFKWVVAMLWRQYDDIWWITNEKTGAFYYVSTPFILFGLLLHVKTLWECIRQKKEFPLHFMLAVWFSAMFIISCGIEAAKFYKINCLLLVIVFYGAFGLVGLLKMLYRIKWLPAAAALVYLTCFGYFLYTEIGYPIVYENYGQSALSHMLWYRYEDALDRAKELTEEEISILNLNYANVLLYSKLSPEEFQQAVAFSEDNPAFRKVISLGQFHFDVLPSEETKDWVYVFPYNIRDVFETEGYTIENVTECYGVAYKN